jgi:hypothetical protein
MALLYSKAKCPQCKEESLTKMGQMIRCTCGWWGHSDDIEEEVAEESVKYAQVLTS